LNIFIIIDSHPLLLQIHIHLHQSLVKHQPFIAQEAPIIFLGSPRRDYALNKNYMPTIQRYHLHTQLFFLIHLHLDLYQQITKVSFLAALRFLLHQHHFNFEFEFNH
jgi:hypothetical protein